eukprot:TRINITY_DN3784_c1_g3_i1.p1 TRINITY_DN3784_c1_g3~~TRINITY_DN3784_c1_g3_i1.p1  ORF type:complete len:1025 (+),score=87.03 TRINITY_DN3784_c1_g3_i1:61-3135(+)
MQSQAAQLTYRGARRELTKATGAGAVGRLLVSWRDRGQQVVPALICAAVGRCAGTEHLSHDAAEYVLQAVSQFVGSNALAEAADVVRAIHGCSGMPEDVGQRLLVLLADMLSVARGSVDETGLVRAVTVLPRMGDSAAGRSLLRALVPRIRQLQFLMAHSHSACVHSLRECGSSDESRALLAAVVGAAVRGNFDGPSVAMTLRGLSGQTTCDEVRSVIQMQTEALRTQSIKLSAQALSVSLLGLRSCDDTSDVRECIEALLHSAKDSHIRSGTTVASAVSGLQRHGDTSTVRSVLMYVVKDLPLPDLSVHSIARCLHGLRHQHGGFQVRALLRALLPCIQLCTEPLPAIGVAHSFYGLRYMSDNPELRQTIRALSKLVPQEFCESSDLDGEYVSTALYGLHKHGGTLQGSRAVRVLASLAATVKAPLSVGMALYGLRHVDGRVAEGPLRTVLASLRRCGEVMDVCAVSNALFGLSGQEDSAEVRNLLKAMLSRLRLSSSENPSILELGSALYGLNRLPASPLVESVISSLTPAFCSVPTGPDIDVSGGLSMALLGLQNQRSSSAVLRLLTALIPRLAGVRLNPSDSTSGQKIVNCLLGLQSLSDSTTVRRVLIAIIDAMEASDIHLAPPECSVALYGMRSLGDGYEQRRAVSALACGLSHPNTQQLTADEISRAMYGVRNSPAGSTARLVIVALVPHAAAVHPVGVSAQSIGATLYGLSSQPDSPSVRALLLHSARLAQSSTDVFDAYTVTACLNGLRSQPSSPEVRAMLRALEPKILACTEAFCPRNVGNALFGLQGQGDYPETYRIVDILYRHARMLSPAHVPVRNATQCIAALTSLAQAGVNAHAFMRKALSWVPHGNVTGSNAEALTQALGMAGAEVPREVQKAVVSGSRAASSRTERVVQQVFEASGFRGLRFNLVHSTGFEMDIMLGRVLNIELDGWTVKYHATGALRRQQLRDKLLESHGIAVRRVRTWNRSLFHIVNDVIECLSEHDTTPAFAVLCARARRMAMRGFNNVPAAAHR